MLPCGWLVVLRIKVDLSIFQPYLDLEAGDDQSLKIQVARPGIEPRSSCSASQELNHLATAAPCPLVLNRQFLIRLIAGGCHKSRLRFTKSGIWVISYWKSKSSIEHSHITSLSSHVWPWIWRILANKRWNKLHQFKTFYF